MKCIGWLRSRETPEEEIKDLYGVEGVNYGESNASHHQAEARNPPG